MQVNWREVKNMPVFTVSGDRLGKISSAIFDIDSNNIAQYEVRSSFFGSRTFLISPAQIVEWGKDRIVVEDSLSNDLATVGLAKEY